MNFILLCTALLLSTSLRVSFGLNVKCDRWHKFNREDFRNSKCAVFGIEVPLVRDLLEFDLDGENINTITFVHLRTKSGNRGFTTFPKEIFQIFPNVAGICIDSNLQILSQDDWNNATSLKVLQLENNILHSEDIAFNGLKSLVKLDVSKNQLTIIRQGLFRVLNKLQELRLNHNRIHMIEDGAFDIPGLKALELSYNKLTTLSDSVFSNIPNLQVISIEHNKLTHIGRSMFGLHNSTYIILSYNHIEDIQLAEFSKLTRLRGLSLRNSGLSSDSTKTDQKHSVDDNTSLDSLDIERNNLTNVFDLSQLTIFKGLTTLHIRDNPFTNYNQLSAAYIKAVLPKLQYLGWDGERMECDDFSILINQMKLLNVTVMTERWCSTIALQC